MKIYLFHILNHLMKRKEEIELNDNIAYNCRKQKHLHFKDISRIFMTKNGVVKFKYEEIIK